MRSKLIFIASLLLLTITANSQSILGKWKTYDDQTGTSKSIVEITERNGKIYGKVIKLLNPKMANMRCKDCPGTDKDKPVVGIEVLKGLSKNEGKYDRGKILDPSSGKVYKCSIHLEGKNKLIVRGYIGIAALGRSQTWTRVEE